MAKITIVVPCHNEARRLDLDLFRHFARRHSTIKFLFVNDGSQDNTQTMLEQLPITNSLQFDVLQLAQNCGKAEAVRRGILQAALHEPQYLGYWDADLATPLGAIPDFAAVLDRRAKVSMILGIRLPLLGHAIQRRLVRKWLGKIFSRVTALALGLRCHDTQCGAKLFRATPEVLAMFSQPFGSRLIFDVELLARLISSRRTTALSSCREAIYEFPLEQWEDVGGSKLKRGDFFKAIAELASIWWRYLRPGAPAFTTSPLSNNDETMLLPPRRAA